jgi:hypothetical protein
MRSAEWHVPGHTERHVVIDDMLGAAGCPASGDSQRMLAGSLASVGFRALVFE